MTDEEYKIMKEMQLDTLKKREKWKLEEKAEKYDKLKEALKKIKKEIDDSISMCQEYTQNNNWCDGELAGFLQSKDIIDRNLSEVELDEG